MTLPQVHELLAYWRAYPPVHLLVAAALGLHEKHDARDDFAALMALAPGGMLHAQGKE